MLSASSSFPCSCANPESAVPLARQNKAQGEDKLRTYGLVHKETTGITSYVIINGKPIPIQFRADSDPLALKALGALDRRIVLPNARGKKIFLVGKYFAEVKRTRNCPQCAAAEDYHEFKLLDWYITTPFSAVRKDCETCPYLRKEDFRKKSSLELSDFDPFDGRENMDVRRFQRRSRKLLVLKR